jgi:hypothetical protein
MPSSRSSSIFHYTEKSEYLKGILKDGFHPRYSLEDLRWLGLNLREIAFPLVSFCDIPLSRVDDHANFYLSYGIGLKQNWAVTKGITPITYVSHQSELRNDFRRLIRLKKDPSESALTYGFLSYAKPLSGKMYRRGKTVRREFYRECEWRYIPRIKRDHVDSFLVPERFHDQELLKVDHKKLAESYRLEFDASSIKHIILKSDEEIPDFCEFIDTLEEVRFPKEMCQVLKTRITTLDSIRKDY